MCPCRVFHFFFFFPARNVGCLKTQIPKTVQKAEYLAERKKKVQRLCRGTLNACAKFQGLSKTGWTFWTLKYFGVICSNQPVTSCGVTIPYHLQLATK